MEVHHRLALTLVLALGALALLAPGAARADYPLAEVTNNTPYSVSGKVKYASAFCKDDAYSVPAGGTWRARSRGVCLITGITGSIGQGARFGESTSVVPYDSTGTSYSQFQINAYGGQYRIFSKQEYARVSRTGQGKSPGFYLVNKTDWPVAYSLEQVGCLYHDIVPKRWDGKDGVRRIDTGAVWFTLRVHIQPNGINPQSDWDCIEPVAELVGDVLFAAMSGGAGAAMAGPNVVAKRVAKAAIQKAIKATVKGLAKKMKDRVGEYLKETGTVTMAGQYAGYEWPFQCDKMPEYHITGGPELVKDENGDVYVQPGPAFTVTKVNDCGNDMMRLSPKRLAARTDVAFPEVTDAHAGSGRDEPRPIAGGGGGPGGRVTLRSFHGKYVVAEADGKANANRDQAREWEHWQLIRNGNGTVSLKGFHGKYLVAEPDGRANADRPVAREWEQWRMVDNGDGTFSFKSHHGKWLVAEADGRLNANRDNKATWERFVVTTR
ncbi:MAG: hypothetical protein R3F60_14640 [bacterium]